VKAKPGIELILVGHGAKGEPNSELRVKNPLIPRKRHEGLYGETVEKAKGQS